MLSFVFPSSPTSSSDSKCTLERAQFCTHWFTSLEYSPPIEEAICEKKKKKTIRWCELQKLMNSNNILLKMPIGVLKHDATIDWYTVHNRERWKCKPYLWWSSSLLPTLPKCCTVCSQSGEKEKPYFWWSCRLLQLFQNIAQFAHLESQPQKQITKFMCWIKGGLKKHACACAKTHMCMCAHTRTYYGILSYDSRESKKLQWWKEW